mmetsp:Transcript_7629/g.17839  ORF Transcript_7629/g.17839 Transcript_7629/m.17839 type:complete len:127 (-) Transcript_7629:522-902(-)
MPLLVLAAEICPPGVEGTLFAALMSVFNGAGVVGSEAGALLTKVLGVTENNFEQLGLLVAICNLSSLLPLLAIGWIDETVVGSSATAEEGTPPHPQSNTACTHHHYDSNTNNDDTDDTIARGRFVF